MVRNGDVADTVADYGYLIVDECHHPSAASFELVARRSKARYVVGLSATVARKDGYHPIIFMQYTLQCSLPGALSRACQSAARKPRSQRCFTCDGRTCLGRGRRSLATSVQ
ncbi:DEAD/DEAH box helicase family protein [Acidocella sp. C78]|uniref:DEAD/DEAH box helicase family protein n=1 Tax=Acidocella sp. C78 TaxID=1671486 RepID=UPI0035B3AF67